MFNISSSCKKQQEYCQISFSLSVQVLANKLYLIKKLLSQLNYSVFKWLFLRFTIIIANWKTCVEVYNYSKACLKVVLVYSICKNKLGLSSSKISLSWGLT